MVPIYRVPKSRSRTVHVESLCFRLSLRDLSGLTAANALMSSPSAESAPSLISIHGSHTVDVAVGLDQIAKFVIYHSKMQLQMHIGTLYLNSDVTPMFL